MGNCAVREGLWKLDWDTHNPKKQWQLFDVEADRSELVDMAAQNPEIVARLGADYIRRAKSLGR